jgi:hypothetical protein
LQIAGESLEIARKPLRSADKSQESAAESVEIAGESLEITIKIVPERQRKSSGTRLSLVKCVISA